MKPNIVSKPAFSVVDLKIRTQGKSPEIPRLWGALLPRAHEISRRADGAAFGIILNFDEAKCEIDYIVGFEVEGTEPPGMAILDIPAQEYAVFDCILPTLMQAIDQAYRDWLPSSAYRRADGPEFEFYGKEFDPANPLSPMPIYIPVQPR